LLILLLQKQEINFTGILLVTHKGIFKWPLYTFLPWVALLLSFSLTPAQY